ncbi:MAG: thiamine-phosphate kinase [Thermoplasmataceae archaeon]|jgi:thiamine-monophosphate kinase
MKLSELGEREIINRIFKIGSVRQEKDDCAIIPLDGESYLFSTDIVSDETNIPTGATGEQIGRFFASVNLSDIAAMAGIPIGFLSSISIDPSTEWEFLNEIEYGMHRTLRSYDTELLGGDLKEGRGITLTGTIVGKQKNEKIRKRSDIRKDQLIGVTNSLGRAAAGYVFYRSGYDVKNGIEMMMDISPRIREAQIMSEFGARFMTDLSDGLDSALYQLKADFGLAGKIVEHDIPVHESVLRASEISGAIPAEIATSYGGDYELLFTVENQNFGDFTSAMESNGITVSFIGQVWDDKNIIFNGRSWRPIVSRGYEHFSRMPPIGNIRS